MIINKNLAGLTAFEQEMLVGLDLMRQKVISWTELNENLSYKDVRELSKLNGILANIESDLTEYEISKTKERVEGGAKIY